MPVRIVQLSDLHLTTGEKVRPWGSDPWANLRRVLDALATGTPPDLLVLTGDLANRPRPEVYARLREWLTPWHGRLCLVPGNHDSRRMVRTTFTEYVLPATRTVNFVRELGGWKLIGLDSLRRPFVHGKLGREQLDWLDRELGATELPVFLFVHHPPVRVGCWWLDKDRPRDRRALAALIRGSNVRALACGHVHQEFEESFAGARVWTCPSTAYQFRPRSRWPAAESREPAYRVFELGGEAIGTAVTRH